MTKKTTIAVLMAALIQTTVNAQIIYIDDSGKGESVETQSDHFKQAGSPSYQLEPMKAGAVKLKAGLFSKRYELNRRYLMFLEAPKLLQNFYAEAGLNKELCPDGGCRTETESRLHRQRTGPLSGDQRWRMGGQHP